MPLEINWYWTEKSLMKFPDTCVAMQALGTDTVFYKEMIHRGTKSQEFLVELIYKWWHCLPTEFTQPFRNVSTITLNWFWNNAIYVDHLYVHGFQLFCVMHVYMWSSAVHILEDGTLQTIFCSWVKIAFQNFGLYGSYRRLIICSWRVRWLTRLNFF